MRLLGNILWHFPFLGFLTALGALLWGLLLKKRLQTKIFARELTWETTPSWSSVFQKK